MQPITKVAESPTTGLKNPKHRRRHAYVCVCLYTYHPCIIRESTAAIKENPERINEKDGYKFSNIGASYFTTSRTPEVIYMGCTPHQNSTQSEILPRLSFLIPIFTDPFILMKATAVFA